jgi:hypothetical protein
MTPTTQPGKKTGRNTNNPHGIITSMFEVVIQHKITGRYIRTRHRSASQAIKRAADTNKHWTWVGIIDHTPREGVAAP